ncbi:hypothetical protein Ade02nite_57220 [Paractinoplanes deccanensis]|uniref:DUF916 domain-containing protein n=1 Tax=Paractinoplanes deccanensis TaxID=113561 RepID=A0ABQ3YAT2_9ACTN|nr:hypothetical protein [Actinoplanes deccanensis]GID77081.1 hypothetical protein Ade02nite_57220 [Actinoplanes deccanensis]
MRRAAVAALAAALLVPTAPATAAPASALPAAFAAPAAPVVAAPASVTWTVQPATKAGPDGRRWIERTLHPGATVTEHLAVRNFGDTTAVFALKAADGYLTDKGRFTMLPSGRPSVDGGTWIAVQDTVTVGPKQTKVVPFTITVPAKATPGDHPAGIAATIAGRQGTVQVESRVGFRVLLRASGTLHSSTAASSLKARYERSWNPFRAGAVTLTYAAANTGNVRLPVQARVSASSLLGHSTTTAEIGELLPGGTTTASSRVEGVWGIGRVSTTVTLSEGTPVSAPTWVIPWPQLLVLAAAAALVLMLRWNSRRRRRHLERLLEQARQEGRAGA